MPHLLLYDVYSVCILFPMCGKFGCLFLSYELPQAFLLVNIINVRIMRVLSIYQNNWLHFFQLQHSMRTDILHLFSSFVVVCKSLSDHHPWGCVVWYWWLTMWSGYSLTNDILFMLVSSLTNPHWLWCPYLLPCSLCAIIVDHCYWFMLQHFVIQPEDGY